MSLSGGQSFELETGFDSSKLKHMSKVDCKYCGFTSLKHRRWYPNEKMSPDWNDSGSVVEMKEHPDCLNGRMWQCSFCHQNWLSDVAGQHFIRSIASEWANFLVRWWSKDKPPAKMSSELEKHLARIPETEVFELKGTKGYFAACSVTTIDGSVYPRALICSVSSNHPPEASLVIPQFIDVVRTVDRSPFALSKKILSHCKWSPDERSAPPRITVRSRQKGYENQVFSFLDEPHTRYLAHPFLKPDDFEFVGVGSSVESTLLKTLNIPDAIFWARV